MLHFFNFKVKSFSKNTKAVAVPLFALIGFSAITLTIATLDYKQYDTTKAALQSCADQSVLSALSINKDNIHASGTNSITGICQRNFDTCAKKLTTNNHAKVEGINRSCKIGKLDDYTNGLRKDVLSILVNANIKTQYAGKFGIEEFPVTIMADSSRSKKPVEVVFAIPQMGTVCTDTQLGRTSFGKNEILFKEDAACNKFKDVVDTTKESLKDIHAVQSSISNQSFKVGLVPYGYTVRIPKSFTIPTLMTANETFDFFNESNEVPNELAPISPLVEIRNNNNFLINEHLNKYQLPDYKHPLYGIWSRSDAALHTAASMLDPTQPLGPHGGQAGDWNGARKYVVFVADVPNLAGQFTQFHGYKNTNFVSPHQETYLLNDYIENTKRVCDNLKSHGVRIFTVFLNPNKNNAAPTAGQYPDYDKTLELMGHCASNEIFDKVLTNSDKPCHAKSSCFNVKDIKKLDKVYDQIMNVISRPIIER